MFLLTGITAVSAFNLEDNTIKNSNSDDVLFFQDFDDYPNNLRVINGPSTDFTVYNGVGKLILKTERRFIYSNSNLDDEPQYKFNNMTVKARLSNWFYNIEYKKIGKGSFGWGLCNNEVPTYDYEFVWFIYQQGSIFYPWNGLWVWSRSNGEFSTKQIKGYNMREWHVYEIKWNKDSYDFYIDGEQVAQITKVVSQEKLGIEIWNDNAVWYFQSRNWSGIPILGWSIIPSPRRVNYPRTLDIDYIKITE